MTTCDFPRRKQTRLKEYDYSTVGSYFVTICTKNHENKSGRIVDYRMILSKVGQIVDDRLKSLPERLENIELNVYTIMPNHVHAIINIVGAGFPDPKKSIPLGKVIAYFKYLTTKTVNIKFGTPGEKLWQRNYYEHVIRDEDNLADIREYIANNPMKWALDKYYANR